MAGEEALKAAAPLGESVIHIMNTLQDIFAEIGGGGGGESSIELPQVAVVGSQSSGKSSVLEALVGHDFLPKGCDICTRRPLVLQLIQNRRNPNRNPNGVGEEWGEFLHLPGRRFYDFSEIRREIQAETERGAGANKGVSDKQIRLKIFSPNVLDITLVDLPGITKVPVGDQPSDIEARIRTMIMSYIKHSNCLILAVTPANTDLANSDALQIARHADPDGHRTIGVITKLDIMDRGTDACNFLLGKVIPLRLGYIGVVNRSQEDILMNRSIKDALIAEEEFFRSHLVYSDLADRCGVSQLAKKLNQILVQHIKAVLPELRSSIGAKLVSARKEHASYGYITDEKGAMNLLLNILSMYSEAFSSMVEGTNKDMPTSELSGGARIRYIFFNIFLKGLTEVDPFKDLTDEHILIAIQNATGPQSALFVPELPFRVLVQRQIARLLDPSLQCARLVCDELHRISHQSLKNELQRFPVLRKHINELMGHFLQEGLQPLETRIQDMIKMEMDCINTSHPNFIGGSRAIEIASQQVKSYRIATLVNPQKDGVDTNKGLASERSLKSPAVHNRPVNGTVPEQGAQSAVEIEKTATTGASNGSSWGISSIFSRSGHQVSVKGSSISKSFTEPVQSTTHPPSSIHLREPPNLLTPSGTQTDEEAIEITVTKLLLRSYYDIVRRIIEDFVPKATMHFLVNRTKRELHSLFINKLYRENLVEELLQESEEIATKRKNSKKRLRALEQAYETLDELSLKADSVERGYTSRNSSADSVNSTLLNPWSCRSSHSGDSPSPFHLSGVDSNGTREVHFSDFY